MKKKTTNTASTKDKAKLRFRVIGADRIKRVTVTSTSNGMIKEVYVEFEDTIGNTYSANKRLKEKQVYFYEIEHPRVRLKSHKLISKRFHLI